MIVAFADLNANPMVIFSLRYAVSTQWERQVSDGRATVDFHSYFCCCAKRIGHMFALVSRPDGAPVVIAGPCWPFCLFVTLPLIIGVSSLVIYFLVIDDRFSLVCTLNEII
jgi:energy-converting hydrogenase Eha subunit H